MDRLNLKATEETPEILFDTDKPEFRVAGKSYMEDATSFYAPVLAWLQSYSLKPIDFTKFRFELEYLNTASSKVMHDILSILDQVSKAGNEVLIEWHYFQEDEDMLELGEEYQEVYTLPFEFQEIDYGRSENMFEID